MTISGRIVHGWVTGGLLVVAVVLGLSAGDFAGFAFPFDLGAWAISFGVAGSIITRDRPRHGVGRVFLWIGTLSALSQLSGQALGNYMSEIVGWMEAQPALAAVTYVVVGQLWAVILLLMFLSIALFPDGRFPSATVRWAYVAFAVGFGAVVIAGVSTESGDGDIPNPLEGSLPDAIEEFLQIGSVVSGVATLVLIAGVLIALLRGGPVRRRQLSWVVLGLLLAVAATALGTLWPGSVGDVFGMVAFVFVPLGVLVAITRYKLYEIDRIFSRTLAYAVTVALLGGLYVVVVIGSRSVFGVEGEWPVALWTLGAAFALFPLARRVQRWVDRRFFRSRYDSASVVGAFADELRVTVDQDSLVERTESVVGETFQAESVGVWLADA